MNQDISMIRSETIEGAWEQARRIVSPSSVPNAYTDDAVVHYLGCGRSFMGIREIEQLYAVSSTRPDVEDAACCRKASPTAALL